MAFCVLSLTYCVTALINYVLWAGRECFDLCGKGHRFSSSDTSRNHYLLVRYQDIWPWCKGFNPTILTTCTIKNTWHVFCLSKTSASFVSCYAFVCKSKAIIFFPNMGHWAGQLSIFTVDTPKRYTGSTDILGLLGLGSSLATAAVEPRWATAAWGGGEIILVNLRANSARLFPLLKPRSWKLSLFCYPLWLQISV